MKVPAWWVVVALTYGIFVGAALTHNWGWASFKYDDPSIFADGWFVEIARIATFAVPVVLFVFYYVELLDEGISDAVRGR